MREREFAFGGGSEIEEKDEESRTTSSVLEVPLSHCVEVIEKKTLFIGSEMVVYNFCIVPS